MYVCVCVCGGGGGGGGEGRDLYNTYLYTSSGAVRIDSELLKRKHTELQRELHPDKFTTKSQVELNHRP